MARARSLIRPVRTSGALIVNPRRKHRKNKGAARRKAPKLLVNRRHRKARKGSKSRRRRNPLAIRVTRRRNPLAIRVTRRRNPLAIRANGKKHRKHRRKAHRRNPLAIRMKRNGYHGRKMVRRNGAYAVKAKGLMGKASALLAPAGFGAIVTEPLLMVADLMAKYLPTVPTSLVFAGSGVVTALGIMMLPVGSQSTREKAAVAAASAGGALGYFHWRTGQDAPIAASMSGVRALGYSSPVEFLAGPSFAGMGPEAVYPLDRSMYPVS